MSFWILDEARNVREASLDEWLEWMLDVVKPENFGDVARVARTQIDGDCYVSTVFLVHGVARPPFLFETMVFGDDVERIQRRYASWSEAEAGHAEVVEIVMGRRV